MKKLLAAALLVFAGTAARAQHAVGSFNIQPKVGMNVSTLTDTHNSECRIGVAVGAEAEYQLTSRLSLSAGTIYSQQGCKGDAMVDDVYIGKKTMKLDYLNIPLLANFYVTKGLALKAGLQPAFNVNSSYAGYDVEDINTFDLSIPLGVSYEFHSFQVDARYNLGVTKVVDDFDSRNSVLQITLGYKLDL